MAARERRCTAAGTLCRTRSSEAPPQAGGRGSGEDRTAAAGIGQEEPPVEKDALQGVSGSECGLFRYCFCCVGTRHSPGRHFRSEGRVTSHQASSLRLRRAVLGHGTLDCRTDRRVTPAWQGLRSRPTDSRSLGLSLPLKYDFSEAPVPPLRKRAVLLAIPERHHCMRGRNPSTSIRGFAEPLGTRSGRGTRASASSNRQAWAVTRPPAITGYPPNTRSLKAAEQDAGFEPGLLETGGGQRHSGQAEYCQPGHRAVQNVTPNRIVAWLVSGLLRWEYRCSVCGWAAVSAASVCTRSCVRGSCDSTGTPTVPRLGTRPVLDAGAVVEFYSRRHLSARVDLGDTVAWYGSDIVIPPISGIGGALIPRTGGDIGTVGTRLWLSHIPDSAILNYG
jgi:hypothetical protein